MILPAFITTARAFVGQYWRVLALVALLAIIGVQQMRVAGLRKDVAQARAEASAERSAHQQSKAAYRAAQAEAALRHEAVKIAIENQWKGTADETENRMRAMLAAARANAERMLKQGQARAGVARGSGCAAPAEPATPSTAVAGTDILPQLDAGDVRTCTENTVKALGWASFYEGLRR